MKPLVVVGAGPVGLATAIALRSYGQRCLVVDKRTPPFDKACGEGLMPQGVRHLAWLGVRPSVAAPIAGIRYLDGASIAEGRFATPGLGIRRTVLSEALLQRAVAVGVDLRFGVGVFGLTCSRRGARLETSAGVLETPLVIGADGLHSQVRALAGITARPGSIRFGVRRHYRVRPWSACVDVHWADQCEAYVTPVADDCVGVAILAGHGELRFDAALALFPELEERLAGAEVVSRLRGAGPFAQHVARRYDGQVALVGDAAGYLDALTGEGLTIGFACARALAETIIAGRPLADYELRYRAITRTYYALTSLMLGIARQPALRRGVIRTLAWAPKLFDAMLALNGGARAG